jgi:hypothetical protein
MPYDPLIERERAVLEAIDRGLVTINAEGEIRKPASISSWDIVRCFLDGWATADSQPHPHVELTWLGKHTLEIDDTCRRNR